MSNQEVECIVDNDDMEELNDKQNQEICKSLDQREGMTYDTAMSIKLAELEGATGQEFVYSRKPDSKEYYIVGDFGNSLEFPITFDDVDDIFTIIKTLLQTERKVDDINDSSQYIIVEDRSILPNRGADAIIRAGETPGVNSGDSIENNKRVREITRFINELKNN